MLFSDSPTTAPRATSASQPIINLPYLSPIFMFGLQFNELLNKFDPNLDQCFTHFNIYKECHEQQL